MSIETLENVTKTNLKPSFQYLIIINPLGFLYGSAGRFLSPENLVGVSGSNFPPNSATLSGIFAHQLRDNQEKLDQLQLAGPFFAEEDNPDNFYVPTPLNCLVKDNQIQHIMFWHEGKWQTQIKKEWGIPPNDKFATNTWLAIGDWTKLLSVEGELPEIKTNPWRFVPHLHPKLERDQRRVVPKESEEGSLFLENGVQLNPDYCLVYLSNTEINDGWYRFGGEGHLVELECKPISETTRKLLDKPLETTFATITAGIWGSNRFSYRAPKIPTKKPNHTQTKLLWADCEVEALLTGRALPFRYRLGKRKLLDDKQELGVSEPKQNQARRLSRGRYATPAGTVYVLNKSLGKKWEDWDEDWFPQEGYSFKRWGCALALPLEKPLS